MECNHEPESQRRSAEVSKDGISKIGMIGVLLAGLTLPTFGRAAENNAASDSPPAAASLDQTPESRAIEAGEINYPSRPTQLTTYGSTFAEGSEVLKKHYAIQSKVIRGEAVDPAKVADLFYTLALDTKAEASSEFIRHYMQNFKDDRSVQAILNFFLKADYSTGSHETVSRYVGYENPKVIALALRVGAEADHYKPSSETLERLRHHTSSDVRAAAVVFSMARKKPITETDLATLVKASSWLNSKQCNRGDEIRLGQRFMDQVLSQVENTYSREQLDQIKMPLLRFMQYTTTCYPGFFEQLDVRSQHALIQSAADDIMVRRATLEPELLFGKGITMLAGLHKDAAFVTWRMQHIADHYEMDVKDILKGPEQKGQYLKDLRELGLDTGQQSVVFNCGHGGPSHFWFTNGEAGAHLSDLLHDPRNVSYREYAEALVLPQAAEIKAGQRTGGVSLGHMRIIFDACYRYDLAKKFQLEVLSLAKEQGVSVESLPVIVTAAQKGMYGWFEPSESVTILERTMFAMEQDNKQSFSFADFYRVDAQLNQGLSGQLPGDAAITNAEDVAIFSNEVTHFQATLALMVESLRARGFEISSLDQWIAANSDQVIQINEVGIRS